jgi:beta-lactamase class A
MNTAMAALVLAVLLLASNAGADDTNPMAPSERLNALVAGLAKEAVEQFKDEKLKEEDFAITLIDLRDPARLASGSFRGEETIFPASVVKLFYLVAAHRWLEDGRLQDSEELGRAMKDMIVESSNDATAMVLEALTDAANGAPLPPAEMEQWAHRRNAVNRYFTSLGYGGINVCQKTYCEGPYGRERVFIGPKFENRNKLTTNATARLLSEVVLGKAVSPRRSKQMMELLKRDVAAEGARPAGEQAQSFVAKGLGKGARLWSKAGWTSTARHDAAYVETEDGLKLVVVIFTTGHAKQEQILPWITEKLVRGVRSLPHDGGRSK